MSDKLPNKLQALEGTVPSQFESYKATFHNQMDAFLKMYKKYENLHLKDISNSDNILDWSKVQPLSEKHLIQLKNLNGPESIQQEQCTSHLKELLDQLVVLKLNGGLGTSMGCNGPKSVIEVRNGKTFLDLVVKQVEYLNNKYQVNVPLVLMNSFNTEEATREIIKKYNASNVKILSFQQKQFPRFWKESGLLVPSNAHPETLDPQEWFPPGHGDVYSSLISSPIYQDLLSQGKRYLFFSNVDNLGATVDLTILDHIVKNSVDFCMEVTAKTAADVKGGTLISYDGQIKLLEIAQVPKNKILEFQDISKFKIFNTNNLWVNLKSIEKNIKKLDNIEIIVNEKVHKGRPVIQLETAAGAAIELFDNSIGMQVPRSRFLPVKKSSDLLLIKSGIYNLGDDWSLHKNSSRTELENPIINLDDKFFSNVEDFLERFPDIPNILKLKSLTVKGDVRFGKNVTLIGNVVITNNDEDQLVIEDNTTIEQ